MRLLKIEATKQSFLWAELVQRSTKLHFGFI